MRNCMVLCAACAVLGLMASVVVADGLPSAAKMDQMGLSSATIVSDSTAMDVRGFGWRGHSRSSAEAWGVSTIALHSKGEHVYAENGYDAEGKHIAAGVNLTIAGDADLNLKLPSIGNDVQVVTSHRRGGHGSSLKVHAVFAGGFSAAYAK